MRDRPTFLRWLLLNAVTVSAVAALGAAFGGRVHGVAIFASAAICAAYLAGAVACGREAWASDAGAYSWEIAHRLEWVSMAGWACQILGILSTVAGFWVIFSNGVDPQQLASRIESGAGVALTGTFLGILASLALALGHRIVEHSLGPNAR